MAAKNKKRGPCSICGIRLARYSSGLCKPCQDRTEAEGTRKTRTQLIHEGWRERAKEYNRLRRKGISLQDIAVLWGKTPGSLSQLLYKWKTQAKIAVVPSGHGDENSTAATCKVRPYVIAHGGGRWGVPGCTCEPCISKRALSLADMASRKNDK